MGRLRKLLIPGVDKKLLVRDAVKTMPELTRRRFITAGTSLGALTLLTGCDVVDSSSAEELLKQVSKFNDAVQAWMFNPDALAPTFPESMITKPFPFNAYYDLDDAPEIAAANWKLEVRGLVENKKPWTLDELYKLPQVKQVTRHICVEGWSAIGSWTGTPCVISSSWWAPTCAPNMSGSSAPTRTATTRRSTCARRCVRRPR